MRSTLQRWWWELYDYDFDIIYRKGESNIADPFSRLFSKEQLEAENAKDWEELENAATLMCITSSLFTAEKILSRKTEGKHTYYLVKWRGVPEREATWQTKASVRNSRMVKDFNRLWETQQKRIRDEQDSSLQTSIDREALKKEQQTDSWCQRMMDLIQHKAKANNRYEARDSNACLIEDGLLYHKSGGGGRRSQTTSNT